MKTLARLRPRISALAALAISAVGLTVSLTVPASAASWTSYPTATGPRLCTSTRVYGNINYQTCLDYSTFSRSSVRAITFVHAVGAGYASVSGSMTTSSGALAYSCANSYFSAGLSRACASSWKTVTAVNSNNTNVSINGSSALRLKVVQGRPGGKKQETNNYCGVAVIQAALLRMGFTGRAQSTIANYVWTNWLGMTLPSKMDDGLNVYMGSASYKYVQYDRSSTNDSIVQMAASISRNRPTPLLVRPHDLPGGGGGLHPLTRHWLLVDGYAGTISPSGALVTDRVSYWDPWTTETSTLTPNQLAYAAISAGYSSVGQITYVSS